MDRSQVDHENQMEQLKKTHEKYIRRLHSPKDDKYIKEELQKYLDNVKLEEVLTLNYIILLQGKNDTLSENKIMTLANNLKSYKYIREAIEKKKKKNFIPNFFYGNNWINY